MAYVHPMTLAQLKARIDSELSLLGAFDDTNKVSIISDAIRAFCRRFEPDSLNVTLAVTAAVTEYSVPDWIDKISRIYNEDNDRVVYEYNPFRRKINFVTAPSGSVNYTIYGTPNLIRFNLQDSTVESGQTLPNYDRFLASFDEDWEDCIFQYIRAFAAKTARDDTWKDEFQLAELETRRLRQYRNMNREMTDQAMIFRDREGRVIDNSANMDGQTEDINDFGELGDL